MTDLEGRKSLFNGRAQDYVKFRPGYPPGITGVLEENHHLTDESAIADIGCGPGILSRLFLENGNSVYCVDPNNEMLHMARQYLSEFSSASYISGFAEQTSLPDRCVDFLTAGQAFHWFDREKSAAEFRRILKPGGNVVLVWNERDFSPGTFNEAYERICRKYSPKYHVSGSIMFGSDGPDTFFRDPPAYYSFENPKSMDFESVLGRYSSASYAITEKDRNYGDMVAEFYDTFQKFEERGRVVMHYTTKMYVGRV